MLYLFPNLLSAHHCTILHPMLLMGGFSFSVATALIVVCYYNVQYSLHACLC